MGIVVISGKSMWCNGSPLAWNARYVGLNPALGTYFPFSSHPRHCVAVTMDPVQATGCMVVEPTLSIYS